MFPDMGTNVVDGFDGVEDELLEEPAVGEIA